MGTMALADAGTAMDVSSMLDVGTKVVKWAFDLVTANPVLAAVFGLGTLVPAGIAAFSYFKSAAR